jgi:serine protease Do
MSDIDHGAADPMVAISTAARAARLDAGPSVVRIGSNGGRGNGLVLAQGQVLTNAHNLRDRTTLVRFGDGRGDQGEVLGADLERDLAVLAVDTADVPPLQWGGPPEEDDVVLTAVRTSAMELRVSFGLVSGVGRSFRGPRGRTLGGAVEHTAPLVRGSSGSPLIDTSGRLAGINTARLGEGFYLALPADDALRRHVEALAAGEAPDRPRLGIAVAPASVARALRASVGLPERAGVLVRQVSDASPAEQAGIRPGDLLVAAAGTDIDDVESLYRVLDGHDPQRPLPLRLVRGVDELDVEVDLSPAG